MGDIASQFPLRTVQLEGVTFPYFDTGWPLPRVLVELSPWTRWLASLFCGSCIAEAGMRGIDVAALQQRVCTELEHAYHHDDATATRPYKEVQAERLAEDPEYAAFVAMRDDLCVRLVERIAAALRDAAPHTDLGIWGPLEFDGTQLDLDRVLPLLGVLQTRQPLIAPDNARRARELADAHGMRVSAVHWCGGRIGPPWGPDFEAAIRASVELGVDQIILFNWAMLAPGIAAAVVPLLRELERQMRPAS